MVGFGGTASEARQHRQLHKDSKREIPGECPRHSANA